MGLFWKRANRSSADQDRVAEKLAFWLLKIQRRLAEGINVHLRKVRMPVLLALLAAFGTAFGIYCIYLILCAFF